MGIAKIGSSESALDRRERILEEKRKRDAEKNWMVNWINQGKKAPVVYLKG